MNRSLIGRTLLYLTLCCLPLSYSYAAPTNYGSYTLTFGELSSSQLSVSSDLLSDQPITTPILSFTITRNSSDNWTVGVSVEPDTNMAGFYGGTLAFSNSQLGLQWTEPGGETSPLTGAPLVNLLTWNGQQFSVLSDQDQGETSLYESPKANGGTFSNYLTYSFFDDAGGAGTASIDLVFNDSGDATVPEPGMLSLIGLAFVALGLTRRRNVQ